MKSSFCVIAALCAASFLTSPAHAKGKKVFVPEGSVIITDAFMLDKVATAQINCGLKYGLDFGNKINVAFEPKKEGLSVRVYMENVDDDLVKAQVHQCWNDLITPASAPPQVQ